MTANFGRKKQFARQKGFSLFELIVVIAIISILAAVALDRYARLLVDVERTSMQHDLGVLRSAVSMQVAAHFLAGDMQGLASLVNSNPMDLLSEKPKNYLGELSGSELEEIEEGSWYYNTDSNALIYLVTNERYFETELVPARGRFKIYPVYSEKKSGTEIKTYISGLRLRSIEPYQWLTDID